MAEKFKDLPGTFKRSASPQVARDGTVPIRFKKGGRVLWQEAGFQGAQSGTIGRESGLGHSPSILGKFHGGFVISHWVDIVNSMRNVEILFCYYLLNDENNQWFQEFPVFPIFKIRVGQKCIQNDIKKFIFM